VSRKVAGAEARIDLLVISRSLLGGALTVRRIDFFVGPGVGEVDRSMVADAGAAALRVRSIVLPAGGGDLRG